MPMIGVESFDRKIHIFLTSTQDGQNKYFLQNYVTLLTKKVIDLCQKCEKDKKKIGRTTKSI